LREKLQQISNIPFAAEGVAHEIVMVMVVQSVSWLKITDGIIETTLWSRENVPRLL